MKTNKPLYLTRGDYKVTYSDADMPTHYSFKQSDGTEAILREYERLRSMDPAELRQTGKAAPTRMSRAPAERAKAAIDRLDEQGRWVESGRMREDAEDAPVRRVIDCRTFISNVRALSAYLAGVR